MVKSLETRKRVKTNDAIKRLQDLSKNAFKISRSCQIFPRPMCFEVPFATTPGTRESTSMVFFTDPDVNKERQLSPKVVGVSKHFMFFFENFH